MSALSDAAFALVRGWTWLYTCCLPDEVRDSRRLEIESDLWESQHDAADGPDARAAAQVLFRLVLGIPDDLQWSIETCFVRDRLHDTARTYAAIAAAGALLLAAAWAVTAARRPPVQPHRADPLVFIVGSPSRPHPPPPPPPAQPSRAAVGTDHQ